MTAQPIRQPIRRATSAHHLPHHHEDASRRPGGHDTSLESSTTRTAVGGSWAVPVAEDLRDLYGAVARLDTADLTVDCHVYSCPWCPLDVVDANTLAVQIMERHLDRHIAAGDHERPLLRVVA